MMLICPPKMTINKAIPRSKAISVANVDNSIEVPGTGKVSGNPKKYM